MNGGPMENRYKPIRILGSGSFGEIRVARDRTLGRDVAMKVIHGQFANNHQVIERFLQEVEVLSLLEHPNIIPIYDFGRLSDGRPFCALRLVDGNTLEHLATDLHEQYKRSHDSARYQTDRFRDLLQSLLLAARGISFAHQRGVVHRDVKPGNILIGNNGETFVIDWGTAKWLDKKHKRQSDIDRTLVAGQGPSNPPDRTLETLQGMILGTPAFMSPEQAKGDIEHVDRTSDIFSLGATLYFLLTGMPPHKGAAVHEVLGRAQIGRITGVHRLVAACPSELARICERCMAPETDKRYASVDELIDDLQSYLDQQAAETEAITAPGKPSRRSSNKMLIPLVAIAAAAGFFLAAGTGYLFNSWSKANYNRQIAALNEELSSVKDQVEQAKQNSQSDVVNESGPTAESESAVSESDYQELKQRHGELARENDRLTRQQTQTAQQNDELQLQNEALTKQYQDLAEQNDQLADQNTTLTEEITSLTEQNTSLTKQNTSLAEQQDVITEQYSELNLQYQELTSRLNELAERNGELEQQHAEWTAQSRQMRGRLEELQKVAEASDEALNESESRRRQYETNIKDLEQQLAQAELALESARTRRGDDRSDVAMYREQVAELEVQLEEARTVSRAYEKQQEELTQNLARANSELEMAQREFRSAEDELRQLRQQRRDDQREIAQLERRIAAGAQPDEQLVSHYTRDEILEMLKQKGHSATLVDDGEIELKASGNRYRMVVYPAGDVMMYFGIQGGDWTYERINTWNQEQRFTRAYLLEPGKAVLESDLAVGEGFTPQTLLSFTETFLEAAGDFAEFLEDSPLSRLRSLHAPENDSVPPPPVPDDN